MGTRLYPIVAVGLFKDTDTVKMVKEAYYKVPMDYGKYGVLEQDLLPVLNKEYNEGYPFMYDESYSDSLEVDYRMIKELFDNNNEEFIKDFNEICDDNDLKQIIKDYIKRDDMLDYVEYSVH